MNEYEIMIQRFDCDFQLVLDRPNEFSIDKLIKQNQKELQEDIQLLNKLAFLIRHGKAKIEIDYIDDDDKKIINEMF